MQEYIYYEATNLEALREGVRADVSRAVKISIVISAAVLIGALFLGGKITHHLTNGIQQLRTVTRKAGRGDFTVRAELEESDEELAELGEGFNQMVERIKLNYGAQYGIWISSTFMEGTEVRVELPAIKN